MVTRESVYLEKKNYKQMKGNIKDNKKLCKEFVCLYEDGYINTQDLIYIAALIHNVKPGISCNERKFSKTNNSVRGYDIRQSPIYKILTKYKIPFRVDVFGHTDANENHKVTLSNKHSFFTISRDFSNIKKPPISSYR